LISIPIIVGGSTIIGGIMDRYPVVLYAGSAIAGMDGRLYDCAR
jgi:hypothetical protein